MSLNTKMSLEEQRVVAVVDDVYYYVVHAPPDEGEQRHELDVVQAGLEVPALESVRSS